MYWNIIKETIIKGNLLKKNCRKLYNLVGDKINEIFKENDIKTFKMDIS